MPRKAKELSAIQVKRLSRRPGFHAVGGVTGLHLSVKDTLAASWILRVKVGDRRPDYGLGGYPTVTLERAREKAREARELIEQGIDPRDAKREARAALLAEKAKRITFDEAALACWKARSKEFKNAKHAKQWRSTITTYASPVIGSLPIEQVDTAHIVNILTPLWESKTETGSRLRGRLETVLEWARVAGYRNGGDNPAGWTTLKHLLPTPSKLKKVRHHPALPWERMPEFMAALHQREGIGARALEFAVLTAARSGEVRLARWDEIDLDAKVWTVPEDRMKAGLPHRVPLSVPAIKLLKALPRFSDYVFPAPKGGPMSDMSISGVLRRMHEASVAAGGDRKSVV